MRLNKHYIELTEEEYYKRLNTKHYIELTGEERNILDKAYDIINKLSDQVGQEMEDDGLPILMHDEDTKRIGKLADLATKTFDSNQSALYDYGYYDE